MTADFFTKGIPSENFFLVYLIGRNYDQNVANQYEQIINGEKQHKKLPISPPDQVLFGSFMTYITS